jgi:DNA replication protein DnaC
MKTYQSPFLWDPEDKELVEKLPAYITEPDEQAEWLAKESDRRNEILTNSALGEKTGWQEKWREEIAVKPDGDQWKAAFIQAINVIDNNGILILHGDVGNGKTRMAAELSLYVGQSRYRKALRFFLEIRASYKHPTITEMDIMDDLARAKLLILDELQVRGDTPAEDRLITTLIDDRYASKKPTILIANLTEEGLQKSLSASVIDRFRENGLSIEFTWPSFRKPKP